MVGEISQKNLKEAQSQLLHLNKTLTDIKEIFDMDVEHYLGIYDDLMQNMRATFQKQ